MLLYDLKHCHQLSLFFFFLMTLACFNEDLKNYREVLSHNKIEKIQKYALYSSPNYAFPVINILHQSDLDIVEDRITSPYTCTIPLKNTTVFISCGFFFFFVIGWGLCDWLGLYALFN